MEMERVVWGESNFAGARGPDDTLHIPMPRLNDKLIVWAGDVTEMTVDVVISALGGSMASQDLLQYVTVPLDTANSNELPVISLTDLKPRALIPLCLAPELLELDLAATSEVPFALRQPLRDRLVAALDIARQKGAKVVAITPLHRDISASAPESILHVVIRTIRQQLLKHPHEFDKLILVCDNPHDMATFFRVLSCFFPHPPKPSTPGTQPTTTQTTTQPTTTQTTTQPTTKETPQPATTEATSTTAAKPTQDTTETATSTTTRDGQDDLQQDDYWSIPPLTEATTAAPAITEDEAIATTATSSSTPLSPRKNDQKQSGTSQTTVKVVPFVHLKLKTKNHKRVVYGPGEEAYNQLFRSAENYDMAAVEERHILKRMPSKDKGPAVIVLQAKRPASGVGHVRWEELFMYFIRRMHTLVHSEKYSLVYIPHPSLDDCQPSLGLVRELCQCLPPAYLDSLVSIRVWRPPLWLRLAVWRLRSAIPQRLWTAIVYVDSVPELEGVKPSQSTASTTKSNTPVTTTREVRPSDKFPKPQPKTGAVAMPKKVVVPKLTGLPPPGCDDTDPSTPPTLSRLVKEHEDDQNRLLNSEQTAQKPTTATPPNKKDKRLQKQSKQQQGDTLLPAHLRNPSDSVHFVDIGPVTLKLQPKSPAEDVARAQRELEQQLVDLKNQFDALEDFGLPSSRSLATDRSTMSLNDGLDFTPRSFGAIESDTLLSSRSLGDDLGPAVARLKQQLHESEQARRRLLQRLSFQSGVVARLRQERSSLLHTLDKVTRGEEIDETSILETITQPPTPRGDSNDGSLTDRSISAGFDDDRRAFDDLRQLISRSRIFSLSYREAARFRLDMQIKIQVLTDELQRVKSLGNSTAASAVEVTAAPSTSTQSSAV